MTSELRIDRASLRDHADEARIDRVWERLERDLGGDPTLLRPRAARRAFSGWRLVATGMAAGFAAGVLASSALSEGPGRTPPAPVADAPAVDTGRDVFAAGSSRRTYVLPGGGELSLMPGSIVDTISGDASGLTLRLMRGEATLSTRGADGESRSTRLALQIGGAVLTTNDGRVRVRLAGDRARLDVLDGSVDVSAPDGEAMLRRVLGPNQHATVAVRATTARLPVPDNAAHPVARRGPGLSSPKAAEPVLPPEAPAWTLACDRGDYSKAIDLLRQQQGGVGGAVASVRNPKHLMCISTGSEVLDDSGVAIKALERVVGEFADDPYAMTAASDLARIYGNAGNGEKAQYFGQLRHSLSKGLLLSHDALCKKIEAEAQAGNHEAVLRLAARYTNQFPDGSCMQQVERLVAEATAATAEQRQAEELYGDDGGSDDDRDGPGEQAADSGAPAPTP